MQLALYTIDERVTDQGAQSLKSLWEDRCLHKNMKETKGGSGKCDDGKGKNKRVNDGD